MHIRLSSNPLKNTFFSLCFYLFLLPVLAYGQDCPPIENLVAIHYNTTIAEFQWDFAPDAADYVLETSINGRLYTVADLPGNATYYSIGFQPGLNNYDEVSFVLTKHCLSGGMSTATCGFIIVTDAVVYLTGSPQNQGKIKVEPVFAVNDNLVPAIHICGKCEPSYFRLTSGFYGSYGIAMDPSITIPIEQLRFLKTELCNCLDKAIQAGVLNAGGGAGPSYTGTPFKCEVTPYMFSEIDCNRETKVAGRYLEGPSTDLKVMPNPIIEIARINFGLQVDSRVQLSVYDVGGKIIETIIVNSLLPSGAHQFFFDAVGLSPGIYFCKLQTQNLVQTAKVLVLHR